MFGDAQTVSDEDNDQESRSFDAPQGWTTLSSPAGLDLPIAPSWDDGWTAPAPATVEPNAWDASEPLGAGADAREPGGFAGWGGLCSTDSSVVSHDLTAWDSPSDAVVAEAPEAPWGLDEAAEAPVWTADTATTPSVSAWPSLPSPPSSAASAWAPGTLPPPVDEVPEPAVDRTEDGAAPTAPLPSVKSSWSGAEPEPEPEQPVISSWPTNVIAASPGEPATDDEVSEDDSLPYSGVPFHELAAALAASDRAPFAQPIPVLAPPDAIAGPAIADAATPSTDAGRPAQKRRGRLAGRSAQRNASTTDVSSDPVAHLGPSAHPAVSDADGTGLLDLVRTVEVAPLEVFAPSEVTQAAVETQEAETQAAVEMQAAETQAAVETQALPVFEAPALEAQTNDATTAVTSGGFFAKRDPREAASPRETPKALRIGAIVSLLVGLGLFGYSVVDSRSSDTEPTVATTAPSPVAPNADASTTVATPPAAPTGQAEVAWEQAVDPIFGSDQDVSSVSPSADFTAASDPLFGPSPTVPPAGGATAKDELTFDQPGTAGR